MAWEIQYTYIAAKPFLAEHPVGSGVIVKYEPGDIVPASDWGAAANNMLEMGRIFQTAINVEVADFTDDGGPGQGDDASSEVALPDVAALPENYEEALQALDDRPAMLEQIAALTRQLEEATAGSVEGPGELDEDDEIEFGSDEFWAQWDSVDPEELELEIDLWRQDEGAEEAEEPSPEEKTEALEKVQALLDHETAGQARESVIASLTGVLGILNGEEPAKEEAPLEVVEEFPQHKGGGFYVLSNGEKVRGKAAAETAQSALAAAGS